MIVDSTYNEKELLSRVAAGDSHAFGDLLDIYHAIVYGMAIRILRDEPAAEDIVQEVFLKIWLRRSDLATVDNFGGWLTRITSNQLYDHIRRLRSGREHLGRWQKELNLVESSMQISREESYFEELVSQAVERLSPRQKQAFTLIRKEGYSREEAAKMLGIGIETVKSHLEQAMRSIRAYCIGRLDSASMFVIFSVILKNYF